MSAIWKNFQTSGFWSWLVSDVTTCLPLSLHLLRSTEGADGTFVPLECVTISACFGVLPHAAKRAVNATGTSQSLFSHCATVGRKCGHIKYMPS